MTDDPKLKQMALKVGQHLHRADALELAAQMIGNLLRGRDAQKIGELILGWAADEKQAAVNAVRAHFNLPPTVRKESYSA